MATGKSKKEIVDEFLTPTSKEIEFFVQHTLDIAYQVSSLLKGNKITQNELSIILGKEKSEISKWLSGKHNLTLKTISKLEAALNKQIIFTREEVINKITPMIYRKLGAISFNNEQIDSLITLYTYTESLDNFVLPTNNSELKISTDELSTKYEMNKEYSITKTEISGSFNFPKIDLAA